MLGIVSTFFLAWGEGWPLKQLLFEHPINHAIYVHNLRALGTIGGIKVCVTKSGWAFLEMAVSIDYAHCEDLRFRRISLKLITMAFAAGQTGETLSNEATLSGATVSCVKNCKTSTGLRKRNRARVRAAPTRKEKAHWGSAANMSSSVKSSPMVKIKSKSFLASHCCTADPLLTPAFLISIALLPRNTWRSILAVNTS